MVQARPLLALPPRPGSADANVGAVFQAAAAASDAAADRFFANVRMRLIAESAAPALVRQPPGQDTCCLPACLPGA